MTFEINDSSRDASAAAARALSLAVRAEALADEIDALRGDIRAARDESVRRAGFRCDTATDWIRQASTELQDTADHLDRIAAATKPGACLVPWGVCPEHGNTLSTTGGKTWCRTIGCGRTWDYDCGGLPCTEPARWLVTDQHGEAAMMCHGHALDARKRLEGARIEPPARLHSSASAIPTAGDEDGEKHVHIGPGHSLR